MTLSYQLPTYLPTIPQYIYILLLFFCVFCVRSFKGSGKLLLAWFRCGILAYLHIALGVRLDLGRLFIFQLLAETWNWNKVWRMSSISFKSSGIDGSLGRSCLFVSSSLFFLIFFISIHSIRFIGKRSHMHVIKWFLI